LKEETRDHVGTINVLLLLSAVAAMAFKP